MLSCFNEATSATQSVEILFMYSDSVELMRSRMRFTVRQLDYNAKVPMSMSPVLNRMSAVENKIEKKNQHTATEHQEMDSLIN